MIMRNKFPNAPQYYCLFWLLAMLMIGFHASPASADDGGGECGMYPPCSKFSDDLGFGVYPQCITEPTECRTAATPDGHFIYSPLTTPNGQFAIGTYHRGLDTCHNIAGETIASPVDGNIVYSYFSSSAGGIVIIEPDPDKAVACGTNTCLIRMAHLASSPGKGPVSRGQPLAPLFPGLTTNPHLHIEMCCKERSFCMKVLRGTYDNTIDAIPGVEHNGMGHYSVYSASAIPRLGLVDFYAAYQNSLKGDCTAECTADTTIPDMQCHNNDWITDTAVSVDGYISCASAESPTNTNYGARPFRGSPYRLCYPHKKTPTMSFFEPGGDPDAYNKTLNWYYYGMPDCYQDNAELREDIARLKNDLMLARLDFAQYRQSLLSGVLSHYQAEAAPDGGESMSMQARNLEEVLCRIATEISDDIGPPIAIAAIIGVAFMAAIGRANWGLLISTAVGIVAMMSAEDIVSQVVGDEYRNCQEMGNDDFTPETYPNMGALFQDLRKYYSDRVRPILQELNDKQNSVGACADVMLGVNSDIMDDYRSNACYSEESNGIVRVEDNMAPLAAKTAIETCADEHITEKEDKKILSSIDQAVTYTQEMNVKLCYPMTVSGRSRNCDGRPPYQRIYEPEHPWSPRQKRVPYPNMPWVEYCYEKPNPQCPQPLVDDKGPLIEIIDDEHECGVSRPNAFAGCEFCKAMEGWCPGGDWGLPELLVIRQGAKCCPAICGSCKSQAECCEILREPVELNNMLPVRQDEDAYSAFEYVPKDAKPIPHDGYPHPDDTHQGHSTHYMSGDPDYDYASYRFGDLFNYPMPVDDGPRRVGNVPFMQWWEEGMAHCRGCEDALVNVGLPASQCNYGGWEEMKLYQMRCYSFFNILCICDYEKTFKRGSAEEYVLQRAGAQLYELGSSQPTRMRQARRDWPLTWRGYVSEPEKPLSPSMGRDPWENKRFPYAGGYYDNVKAAIKTNLNNAKPGDIVIWDADVIDNTSRKPHVAYVENVRNRWSCRQEGYSDCSDTGEYFGSMGPYIEVSEWNYGKFPDSCGNTDRWCLRTDRTLYKLKDAFTAANFGGMTLGDFYPGDVRKYNRDLKCGDPSLKKCWENLWSRTKVYDPKLDSDNRRNGYATAGDVGCDDTLDGLSRRDIMTDTAFQEKALQDRERGCDPPLSLLPDPGIPSPRNSVTSCLHTNMMVPNQQNPPTGLMPYKGDVEDLIPQIQEVKRFARGRPDPTGSGSSGGSGGGSGGSSGGSSGSSGGEVPLCDIDPQYDPVDRWPELDSGCYMNWTKEFLADPISGEPFSDPVTNEIFVDPVTELPPKTVEYYNIEDLYENDLPYNLTSLDDPVDVLPRPGPVCQPTPDQCTDAPFCFYSTPGINSCDAEGFYRKLRDKDFPFYTPDRLSPNYRNNGYSRDFVVDYLYYTIGFFDEEVNPRALEWMKTMLELTPLEWVRDLVEGETCWMAGPDNCIAANGGDPSERLIWLWNKYETDSPFFDVNDEVEKNIKVGETVAVFISDYYYRGHSGIVSGMDETTVETVIVDEEEGTIEVKTETVPCVHISSSNWRKRTCQQFDEKNCYQAANSFGVACTMRCVPITRIAMMWNPVLEEEPEIPTNCTP